jgi:hypothetical protein
MVTCAQIDVNQCMAGDLRIAGGFEESRCAAEFARYAAFDGTARTAATTGGAGSGSGGAACRLCRIRRRTAITADRGRLIIETEMTFMVRLPSSGDAWERFERTVSHIGSFSNRSPGVIRKPTRTPVQKCHGRPEKISSWLVEGLSTRPLGRSDYPVRIFRSQ